MYRVGLMALTDPVLPWMYLKMHLFSTEKWQENKNKYYINLLSYMYMYCSYNSEPGLQIIFFLERTYSFPTKSSSALFAQNKNVVSHDQSKMHNAPLTDFVNVHCTPAKDTG